MPKLPKRCVVINRLTNANAMAIANAAPSAICNAPRPPPKLDNILGLATYMMWLTETESLCRAAFKLEIEDPRAIYVDPILTTGKFVSGHKSCHC